MHIRSGYACILCATCFTEPFQISGAYIRIANLNDVNIQASFACNYSLGTIFMVNVVHPTQLDSVVAWLVVLVVCGVDIAQ